MQTDDDEPHLLDEQLSVARRLRQQKRLDLALPILRDLLDAAPDVPNVQLEMAYALTRKGDLPDALAAVEEALRLEPDFVDALTLHVALLLETGQVAAAQPHAVRLAELAPGWAEAWRLSGEVAFRLGNLLDARDFLHRAVALRPEFAEANVRLAEVLLKLGEWAEGWRLYEWRWQCRGYDRPAELRRIPRWTGTEPISGRRIVIVAEQGIGDMIQYIRYARRLREREAEVVVTCHSSVASLVRSAEGVAQAIPFGMPLPSASYYVPLLSLPGAFGTVPSNIPGPAPYLAPRPAVEKAWADGLSIAVPAGTKRVGLAWSGHVDHVYNPYRSIPLQALLPLFEVPGLSWISLQVGPRQADLQQVKTPLLDFSSHLTDFEQTAGLMRGLDLVVTVDTAIAHLAGALDISSCLLLHAGCDARWGASSERTPWYPSLRLYRQDVEGDWAPVVERVTRALQAWTHAKTSPSLGPA